MFASLECLVIFLGCSLAVVKGQGGGTTSSGDSYVCVPPGFCDNNGTPNPNPGIDPRIVTPGQICPSGQIQCFTQGPNSNCGVRFIPLTNSADGAADAGTYPWQVYLRNSTNAYAGSGVLLDNYHVLTAAHKIANSVSNAPSVTVFAGVYDPATDLSSPTVQSSVLARGGIRLHPNFNAGESPQTLKNDIAILRLSTPFALSQDNINTACLPAADTGGGYVGQRCMVAGWGQTSFDYDDAPTSPMKQVTLPIVSYSTCRASFADSSLLGNNVDVYLDTNYREICAGGEPSRDACTQDGGAPLTCQGADGKAYIAGLVIWGKSCGNEGVYGVYVSVPYYRNWIDTTITSLNAGN